MRRLKNVNFCSSSRKAIRLGGLTTGIYRIFRGLKIEPDAEIGQKVAFCKGLRVIFLLSLILSQSFGFLIFPCLVVINSLV